MLIYAALMIRAGELIRRRIHDYALAVAALAALFSQAVHATVDFSLEIPANVVLLLAIAAIGLTPRHRAGR